MTDRHTSHRWGLPVLTLGAYLKFWAIGCYLVTVWLIFFKKEVRTNFWCFLGELTPSFKDKEEATDADMTIKDTYKTIWTICQLKRSWHFNEAARGC
jgi:hypothetical protein